jgi:hypothetical protein
MTKLCPRGKAAAKRKFKVYPSAYANAYASKICAGKIKDPSGVKRKDFRGPKPMSKGGGADTGKKGERKSQRMVALDKFLGPSKRGRATDMKVARRELFKSTAGKKIPAFKVGKAVTAGAQSGMGRLQKSGMAKAKKGKMMIIIAIGKPKKAVKKANKGAIMKVASKLEKASKAHAGQAKTLRSIKVRGGGMAMQGMNFKGVY